MSNNNSHTSSTFYSYGTKTIGQQPVTKTPNNGLYASKASSSRYYSNNGTRERLRNVGELGSNNTFLTPDRVDQVFDFNLFGENYYGECVCDEKQEDECDAPLHEFSEVQLSLNMETIDEVEAKLVKQINKYRRATEAMAGCALLWWDLMTDLNKNPHLAEEFKKFQMLRKLSGGTL